jgi:hypothetical protein
MSLSAVDAAAGREGGLTRERSAPRPRFAWLFSWRADLAMVLVPPILTAAAFAVASWRGQTAGERAHAYAGWVTAYVLGNTSHVLLTFLILALRPDVLHATERQARTLIPSVLTVFAGSLALMRVVRNDPWTSPLWEAVLVVFATHHTLSQAKGFWALYGLRGAQAGLPANGARERDLQKLFVPLALLFIAVKWTLVGKVPVAGSSPYKNVNPGDPAVLPFTVTYGLLAAWIAYVAALFRALLSAEAQNLAKLVYLGVQCSVVAVELLAPTWGVTMAAGIHGLEYYFLTRKMLAPLPEDTTKITSALCWPAMIAAMSPILAFGVVSNPWVPQALGSDAQRTWATMLVNACVLAHYCADAFIYRFRIPGIRKVALARLGFAA